MSLACDVGAVLLAIVFGVGSFLLGLTIGEAQSKRGRR